MNTITAKSSNSTAMQNITETVAPAAPRARSTKKVVFIILAVMANTMAMTARERIAEHATLKALGFGPGFLGGLIYGESLAIAFAGAGLGVMLTFPVADWFGAKMGTLFPVFEVSPETVWLQFACALVVGLAAAVVPAYRAAQVRIVEGLRAVG